MEKIQKLAMKLFFWMKTYPKCNYKNESILQYVKIFNILHLFPDWSSTFLKKF